MPIDGSPNSTALYIEPSNAEHMPTARVPHYAAKTLYSHLSPVRQLMIGRTTPNNKFIEVTIEGELIYSEATRLI